MLVANIPDWWDLMLLRHLPYQVYNTSYDIAHRCVRTRRCVRTEEDTTCRLSGTDTGVWKVLRGGVWGPSAHCG